MSATPTVTNPEDRQQLLEQARTEAREEKQQNRQAASIKERIEQNLASETVTLPVGGESVDFSTFGRETSEWASVLQERIRRLDGDNYQEEFSAEVDQLYETLGTHSEPDWMTRGWWEKHVPIRRAIQYVVSVNAEADISEGEIESFRGQ